MSFGEQLLNLLPSYLSDAEKSRLRDGLQQFAPEHKGNKIDYTDFFKSYAHDYFKQSDLLCEVRFASWNEKEALFDKLYTDALIISNTCDISFDNKRSVNPKQCLFAPAVAMDAYLYGLKAGGYTTDQINTFETNVRSQQISNVFFLPKSSETAKEYLVLLDRVFWFPIEELKSYEPKVGEDIIASLSHFGYYLFIFKLSYHLCRLPEQCDREVA